VTFPEVSRKQTELKCLELLRSLQAVRKQFSMYTDNYFSEAENAAQAYMRFALRSL